MTFAQPAAQKLTPNLESNIERPLRYRPDGADFVIENGTEFFNRPLYGGNTAFRVDGGDKPEFVLYLPGRGGNLRLGLRSAAGTKWLHEAASITTRYRPGELLYQIRDPLLGEKGLLKVAAIAAHQTEALLVGFETEGVPSGVELIWAYGGVNGQRGQRDGDIGTERVPISEWFQLKPEFAKDNRIETSAQGFMLRAKAATIAGLVPAGAQQRISDAPAWDDPSTLLNAQYFAPPQQPVVVGRVQLTNGTPQFIALQRVNATEAAAELDTYKEVGAPATAAKPNLAPAFAATDLPRLFAEAEAHFAQLRSRVSVETPDPFINAAVGALNVAADAVWDEPQQAIMHGAIAWRTKLLGWRGPYSLDALGWHDRARKHFEYWATRQNTSPIPDKLPPPDENANLARSEAALHSNGDLSNSHYDMNLVFIDALFRHLRWTGDIEFAKKMWPVIERHLTWERRLLRREFTTATGEKLPLYEAYAAIWASDDLQYSGGGSAHGSAYNYFHNKMAAQLAPLIGADPAPYAKEAELIARGMRALLWVEVDGELQSMFAESKDWLGLQRVHPSAALWSFYHVMDAELVSPKEAAEMVKYVRNYLPHIPVRGPGVPEGLHTLSTSNWMPYTWSLNNVTLNENAHGALGLWQAGAPEEAFVLFKGSLIAAMFMGISPGNVGSMSYLDVYRRESQRDFADGSGTLSRAVIEGLFGIRPDLMTGRLVVSPGFPHDWQKASLHHPKLNLAYRREGLNDHWEIASRFDRDLPVHLRVPTHGRKAAVTINGRPAQTVLIDGDLAVVSPPAKQFSIAIQWDRPAAPTEPPPPLPEIPYEPPVKLTNGHSWEIVDLSAYFNDRVTELFRKGKYRTPRSPFVSLALPAQGIGYWAGHMNAMAEIDDTGLRAAAAKNGGRVVGNGLFATPGPGDAPNIIFTSQWDNYPREVTVPLRGKAFAVYLLMAGSTNAMQSRLVNGEVVVTYTDGTTHRLGLSNPETWWPIEQDYFIDDYQFRIWGPLPSRLDLKTGQVRHLWEDKPKGNVIPGGAATILDLRLDSAKELHSLTVRAVANDVVIGLMAATLER